LKEDYLDDFPIRKTNMPRGREVDMYRSYNIKKDAPFGLNQSLYKRMSESS